MRESVEVYRIFLQCKFHATKVFLYQTIFDKKGASIAVTYISTLGGCTIHITLDDYMLGKTNLLFFSLRCKTQSRFIYKYICVRYFPDRRLLRTNIALKLLILDIELKLKHKNRYFPVFKANCFLRLGM